MSIDSPSVIPVDGPLGAEVRGINLRDSLTDKELDVIVKASQRYIVLVFRNQCLRDDQLIGFGKQFGTLHRTEGLTYGGKPVGTAPEIEIISNQFEDCVPTDARPSDECTWHTDMSMFETPASFSILYAEDVPSGIGQTRFANLYSAYETLPYELRKKIEGRRSIHDSAYTAMGEIRAGFSPVTDKSKSPGADHPIVRTHDTTGRKALFLGRKGYGYIPGLTVSKSDELLAELWSHMTEGRFVWQHEWRNGDVVMWDNRCCTHSRSAFDPSIRRRLRRVTVIGQRPI
ncbi:MAG: TauD/TfdA family dioxygenase [Dehalococcoidia bacterium]|nr:TauD/TfdA family dioxygenase [Dehalococcoidia bacterium]